MAAKIRRILGTLSDVFWLLPGALTLLGVILAIGMLRLDRNGSIPDWWLNSEWVYNGGGTGARTLLGAIASSTIGVAGTVFSITIAALSLAAGQMGPRLLRNFTRDRGVQFTLGAFLGTFSYALMVLRSVRTQEEGAFTPHLSLSIGILLAFVCVGTLVYFVGHMAGRINVDTVVELVSEDVGLAVRRLTQPNQGVAPAPQQHWHGALATVDPRRGYLQHLDVDGLADWAASNDTVIRLSVRPGDYVFPGAPNAVVRGRVRDAGEAILRCSMLGPTRVSSEDIEFAVRQLVEVAVRALSPGINDPHTAISVLDRLGAALCDIANVFLPTGVHRRDGVVVLEVPSVDYDGLTDAMFHLIRQNARGSVTVLVRMLEVLSAVATCERDPARGAALQRHAGLVLEDGERDIESTGDLDDLRKRHGTFLRSRSVLNDRETASAVL